MELLLNLLWLLIAAAAIALWRMRWMREERRHRRDPLHEGVALGCALVLLFFAVSLSDDLHAEVILFDECTTGRRHTACAHHSPQPGKSVDATQGPAVLPRVLSFNPLRPIGITVLAEHPKDTGFPNDSGSGRAPPNTYL